MEFKKEFYDLEILFEQKQYLSIILKSISVFEFSLRELFLKYIDSVKNINDKKKISAIINTIGKTTKTIENMHFEDLIFLEKKLNIFFNLKKDQEKECFRIDIINLEVLNKQNKKLIYNKALIQRIDAEVFLFSLKIFLLDFNLMEPLFASDTKCNQCGNNIPSYKQTCPFCNTSLVSKQRERFSKNSLDNALEKEKKLLATEQFVPRINNRIEKIEKNKKGFWEAEFFNNSIMIYIPEGDFLMGTDSEDSFPKERPNHMVNIFQYWISKFETSFNQYLVFCEDTGTKIPYDENWGGDNRPVINISWFDANSYCEWVSIKTGLVFRLPTEAEWEKASKGTENRLFPWGDNKPTIVHANYNYNIGKTSEIGSYPSGISPYGLLDMSGNLREWCLDWYDEHYYKESPTFNPKGPLEGDLKVIRGGGWGYDESFLRATDRNRWIPDDSSNEIGFRIVLESK